MAKKKHIATKIECLLLLENQILVEYLETPEKTSGGIFIPSTVKDSLEGKEIFADGEVKNIGALCVHIKFGDRIMFRKNSADIIEIRKKKYYLIKESYIACIIERKI